MARKRKRSDTQDGTPKPAKRAKTAFGLSDLPIEILDTILSYALPDPRGIEQAVDRDSTAKLYTSPILRTSQLLRQQCLSIIDRRIVWVRVKFHDSASSALGQSALTDLPLLPSRLQHLIPHEAPRVSMEFNKAGPPTSRETRSSSTNSYLLPANISTLIRLCEDCSNLAFNYILNTIIIKYENMNDSAWQEVKLFIVPAMTWLRNFDDVEFVPEINTYRPDIDAGYFVYEEWPLMEILDKAEDLLERADKLEEAGYVEEAGLMYLHNEWQLDEAAAHLPCPEHWVLGEVDPRPTLTSFGYRGFDITGRCPQGNKLRMTLFEIEHRACVAYGRFLLLYGNDWCEKHPWGYLNQREFDRPDSRFLYEPEFSWFGIATEQEAQLHYDRAVLLEICARKIHFKYITASKRGRPRMDEAQYVCKLQAAGEITLARCLLPENEQIKTLYGYFEDQLYKRDKHRMKRDGAERFGIVLYPLDRIGQLVGKWSGDLDMLDDWGGNDVLKYLPLAQKFPEDTNDQLIKGCFREHPLSSLLEFHERIYSAFDDEDGWEEHDEDDDI